MRINELKAQIYERCGVTSTPQLKKQYSHLTQGKDLRFKTSWQAMLEDLADDYTLADMERDDQLLKQSLHRVGRVLGHSHQDVEEAWEHINNTPLETAFVIVEGKSLATLEVK